MLQVKETYIEANSIPDKDFKLIQNGCYVSELSNEARDIIQSQMPEVPLRDEMKFPCYANKPTKVKVNYLVRD